MKKMLVCLLVMSSLSVYAQDINLKCIGSSIKVLDKFSYTEDERLLETELEVNSKESVMIVVGENEMKVVKKVEDISNKIGASVLYITQASEQDDTLVDGVNVFHATLNTNTPGQNENNNLIYDLDVKTANTYIGESFSLMDIERNFSFGCARF